jgi:hypothetical protein
VSQDAKFTYLDRDTKTDVTIADVVKSTGTLHGEKYDSIPQPGAWLASLTSAERKNCPIHGGALDYFPDAIAALARHSKRGNDKHNPGQPLHWDRDKSTDHAECIGRHLAELGKNYTARDAEGQLHVLALLWRAAALAQVTIEGMHARGEKV